MDAFEVFAILSQRIKMNGVSPEEVKNAVAEYLEEHGITSPVANVMQTEYGALITIEDEKGMTTAMIYNGKNGKDGKDGEDGHTPQKNVDYRDGIDGFSPEITVNNLSNGYRIVIVSKEQTDEIEIYNGIDGHDGNDGESVSITGISESVLDGGENIVTFSDGNVVRVKNGKTGTAGKSAYQYAKDGGYAGSEIEFRVKLAEETYSKQEADNKFQEKGNYALKTEIPEIPVKSVNGKTGDVALDANSVGARSATWVPSAQEVGADPVGTASAKVSEHNADEYSHNDIRILISNLAKRIETALDSTDVDLDQLSELIAYMESNRDLINQVTTKKVNVSDIIDNLQTSIANQPLSAKQGAVLKNLYDELKIAIQAISVPKNLSDLAEDSTHRTVTDTEKQTWNNKANKATTLSGYGITDGATKEEMNQLSQEKADYAYVDSKVAELGQSVDDITLVENAYNEETAKYNYRLAGNSGAESPYNGSLTTDFVKVKYNPDAYALISGIDHLVANYDMYFSVNYYDADKQPTGTIIMPHTKFGTYDGTLPLSFALFEPMINNASDVTGIENTEYVRIKLGIAASSTSIGASNCAGLTVKIATRSKISPEIVGMPSHWEEEVAEKTEVVRNLQAEGGKNCVTFAFTADTHIPNNATGRTEHIGRVMGRMLDNCQAPFAVLAGDVATRGSMPTESEYFDELAEIPYHLASLWGTDRLLLALGNHDGTYGDGSLGSSYNYSERFNQDKMWSVFFRGQALDFRRVFSENGLYFFVDNITQKTRFIVLNSHYAADLNGRVVFNNSCYGQEQLDWFADIALDMLEGYGAVVITHVAPRPVNEATIPYTVDYMQIVGIINAYIDKTTFSNSFTGGVDGWSNSTVNVDFTSAKGEVIAMFVGHEHRDIIDTETLKCPIINVVAAGAPANGSYTSYNRPFGTGKETSFDMVTINRTTKMIYCTRVGAGSDRAVSYAKTEVVTYAVTNTLTNATNSNTATSVAEGDAYTGTITANDGYTLDSVNVTMGGVDITSTAVNNGVISIASATGDIVITAIASETSTEPSYTNLAAPNNTNTSDWGIWINNARMGSDGAYRSSTNSMVTNYITIRKNDTVYFMGTGMTSTGNGVTSGQQIAVFESATNVNTTKSLYGGTPETLVSAYNFPVTYHEDGTLESIKFTSLENEPDYYLRVCLANTVDKSSVIITVNEPIV